MARIISTQIPDTTPKTRLAQTSRLPRTRRRPVLQRNRTRRHVRHPNLQNLPRTPRLRCRSMGRRIIRRLRIRNTSRNASQRTQNPVPRNTQTVGRLDQPSFLAVRVPRGEGATGRRSGRGGPPAGLRRPPVEKSVDKPGDKFILEKCSRSLF